MLITKSIGFNMNDVDAVALEVAEEIKKGWHIKRVEYHDVKICPFEVNPDPAVTIHFVRGKERK